MRYSKSDCVNSIVMCGGMGIMCGGNVNMYIIFFNVVIAMLKLKLKRNQCNDLIYIIVYSTIYNFQDKETRVEMVPYQDHLKLSVTRLYHKKGSDKERSTALPVYLRSLCC